MVDYGFKTTEPIQGETLGIGKYSRWVGEKVISASSQVGVYS